MFEPSTCPENRDRYTNALRTSYRHENRLFALAIRMENSLYLVELYPQCVGGTG